MGSCLAGMGSVLCLKGLQQRAGREGVWLSVCQKLDWHAASGYWGTAAGRRHKQQLPDCPVTYSWTSRLPVSSTAHCASSPIHVPWSALANPQPFPGMPHLSCLARGAGSTGGRGAAGRQVGGALRHRAQRRQPLTGSLQILCQAPPAAKGFSGKTLRAAGPQSSH